MNPTKQVVKEFLERWERIINTLDLDLIASQYADPFMFADPSGVRVIEKQRILAALPRRQEFYKALGHKSTKILSLWAPFYLSLPLGIAAVTIGLRIMKASEHSQNAF